MKVDGRTCHLQASPVQKDFIFDDSSFAAFVAGIGSGKTVAGAYKVLATDRMYANHGMVVGPTVENLRDTTWETCVNDPGLWKPWITKVNKTENTVRLSTGCKVLFKSADKPKRLRGPNLSWVWIDEAAQISKEAWQILIGRLREGGSFGSIFITTTPEGKNWVYDEFAAKPERSLYRCSTRDNPFLDPEVHEVLEGEYGGDYADQELRGKFVEFGAGLIEREWLNNRYEHLPPRKHEGNGSAANYIEVVQSWDTAFKAKESNDFTCGQTWIRTENAYYMWHEYVHDQMSFPELKRVVQDYYRRAQSEVGTVHRVLIEDMASGQSLVQELQRDTTLPITPVSVDRDKVARANACLGLLESGNVMFPATSPWMNKFVEEVTRFPEAEHDDQVDAMTQALNHLKERETEVSVFW
jgi:predicted phage terminase large subunit-like protein